MTRLDLSFSAFIIIRCDSEYGFNSSCCWVSDEKSLHSSGAFCYRICSQFNCRAETQDGPDDFRRISPPSGYTARFIDISAHLRLLPGMAICFRVAQAEESASELNINDCLGASEGRCVKYDELSFELHDAIPEEAE